MCCYTCVTQQRWSERAVIVHWRLTSALTSFRNDVRFKPNKAGNVTVYTNYEPVHRKHNHAECCGTTMKPGAWVNQFHQDINVKSSKLWDVRRSLQVFKMTARHTFSQSPILQLSSKKPFKRRILCLQFEKISSKKCLKNSGCIETFWKNPQQNKALLAASMTKGGLRTEIWTRYIVCSRWLI